MERKKGLHQVSTQRPVRRALISVYDKTGLEELASGLHAAGVELVSTGSTAKTIAAASIPVTPVEDVTGFPEVLDGRVKTLHPHVHAGVLADTRREEHLTQLEELGCKASSWWWSTCIRSRPRWPRAPRKTNASSR